LDGNKIKERLIINTGQRRETWGYARENVQRNNECGSVQIGVISQAVTQICLPSYRNRNEYVITELICLEVST
jgi:hypothetical protein